MNPPQKSPDIVTIINDIIIGLKKVPLNDCSDLSQIKFAFRSLFGEEYKESDKEIIAEQLKGRLEGLHDFLQELDCLWLDFIGCDSFSDSTKKQIFFATISRTQQISDKRYLFVSRYNELVKKEDIPLDILVQLFFADRKKFIENLQKDDNKKDLDEFLEKIQDKGFVLLLSGEEHKQCDKDVVDDGPYVLNLEMGKKELECEQCNYFGEVEEFSKAITEHKEQKRKRLLHVEIENLLRYIIQKEEVSDLVKIVTKFNRSLFPNPKEVNLLYFIPNHCPDGAIGLCCFGTNRLLAAKELNEMKLLSYNVLYPYVTSYKSAWESSKILKESIKSAKSAIMSRNMSHNLGSHVMVYLKQQLSSPGPILNGNNSVLGNLAKKLVPEQIDGVELPFLIGLGRFIGYLQERQDYIATISTDYIPYSAPINMKDAIYDELNPDLRYMRHKSKEMNRPMNILLNYIAKSEGLSRENMSTDGETMYSTDHDILFGFIRYYLDDSGASRNIVFGQGLDEKDMGSENEALSVMRKINFSLPGGLIGRQAVFSIIENIIRNAAKHGDINGNLCFTFDVLDAGNLENELEIESRIGEDWLPLYLDAADRSQHYLLTITDNLWYPKELAGKLRKGLEENYVDPFTGVIKESNKGLKEIRISASWLRGETDETQYQKFGVPNSSLLLPLVGTEITKEGNHLRYIFAVKKYHEVAYISECMDSTDLKLLRYLSDDAPIEWTSCKSVAEYKERYKKECFRYIIVANKDVYKLIRPYAPNRVIIWDSNWQNNENKGKLLECLEKSHPSQTEEQRFIFNSCINNCKQQILSQVYRLFAPDSEESFYVFDNISEESHSAEDVYDKIRFGESRLENYKPHSHVAKYVYRTHHATQSLHSMYWKMRHGWAQDQITNIWSHKDGNHAYESIVSIDGITGDNSSDRLVRREPLTEEWYFSHLRAMKTKVAIFDERIFKIVHNIEENEFATPSIKDVEEAANLVTTGKVTGSYFDSVITRVFSVNKDDGLEFMFLETIEDKISLLRKQIKKDYKKTIFTSNHQPALYHDKLIDVYTVLKGADEDFVIIGCVSCGCSDDDKAINGENGEIYEYVYDKIATIGKDLKIHINETYKDIIKYDMMSIHQGLLDKIYEGFGIQEYADGCNDKSKRMVTEELYKGFICDSFDKIIECDYNSGDDKIEENFLPGMVVHSGRSKPTKVDMPQHLPFVQYSAIEHAVKDCKFNLVELLDYAKYE